MDFWFIGKVVREVISQAYSNRQQVTPIREIKAEYKHSIGHTDAFAVTYKQDFQPQKDCEIVIAWRQAF